MFPIKKYKKIESFLTDYLDNINKLSNIKISLLNKFILLIEKTIKNKNNIFVCGNGGSAAIANHYLCDYLKLLRTNTTLKPIVTSLSSSVELITAISNDINYESIFSYQAECLANKNDLFILVSSSGNSKNIINVAKFAKKNKCKVIGFTGFDGGLLKKIADLSIHVPLKNYGLSEDSHHILMHILMQFLRQKHLKTKISKTKF
jgi:phosphoheptose isomerase